jgi:hypothetical protein
MAPTMPAAAAPPGVPGLEYDTPPDAPPGVVTAVGVVSLVAALLSFVASVIVGAQALRFGAMLMRMAEENRPFIIYASDSSAPGGASQRREVTVSLGPSALVVFESVVSMAMAVFLFAAGIRALGGSRKSVGMHRAYAGVKLFLAFAAAVGVGWLSGQMKDLDAAFYRAAPEPAGILGYLGPGLVMLVVGIAYPVLLLLLLRGRGVEAFARGKDRRHSGPADDAAALAAKLGFVQSDEETGVAEGPRYAAPAPVQPASATPLMPPPPRPAAAPRPEPADLPPPDDVPPG